MSRLVSPPPRTALRVSLSLALYLCGGAQLHAQGSSPPERALSATGSSDVAYLATPKELLQLQLDPLLRSSAGAHALVGAEIRSVTRGDVLYSLNSERLLQPASNVKLFTVAGALHYLGPDFVFRTTLYATGPVQDGVLRGDLVLEGQGDPNLSGRFYADSVTYVFDDMAAYLHDLGVRRVTGDLVGDNSYFEGPELGEGWTWDAQQFWYSAQIDALSFNDNTITVIALPGPAVGAPARILKVPDTEYVTVRNEVRTTAGRRGGSVWTRREPGTNVVTVGGTVPVRGSGGSAVVTVDDPARYAVTVFRERLARAGITIDGATRVAAAEEPEEDEEAPRDEGRVALVTHFSPPLGEVIKVVNKRSQNFYAEQLLKTIGAETRGRGTASAGIAAIDEFLRREVGVAPGTVYMADGSGLSHFNLVTPGAIVKLLAHMARHPYGREFFESLAVAGEDGGSQRLDEPLTRGNVHAKTGTVRHVSAYSGYVDAADGERLAFSIIVNNRPHGKASSVQLENAVVRALARFKR